MLNVILLISLIYGEKRTLKEIRSEHQLRFNGFKPT